MKYITTNGNKMKLYKIIIFIPLLLCFSTSSYSATLNGTYELSDGSAYWIFGNGSGEFWQVKSINGNLGKIVINFTYNISDETLNYTQTRIALVDHPDAKSQSLNKSYSEKIEVRPDRVILGGKDYFKK